MHKLQREAWPIFAHAYSYTHAGGCSAVCTEGLHFSAFHYYMNPSSIVKTVCDKHFCLCNYAFLFSFVCQNVYIMSCCIYYENFVINIFMCIKMYVISSRLMKGSSS